MSEICAAPCGQIRDHIVLRKDMSPNYCEVLYFVPSKFMD